MSNSTFWAYLLRFALVVAILSVAPSARAASEAAAEALFREARRLMEAGEIDQACKKFAESLAIDPSTGTLLNLATCHAKQGKTATAWAEFSKALDDADKERDDERVEYARAEIARLEPALSRITVVAPDTEGLRVTMDGEPVVLNTGIPYDPGPHRLEATAPGRQPFATEVALGGEADTKTITIPELSPSTAPARPVAAPVPPEQVLADSTRDAPPKAPQPWRKPLAYAVGGVGVVALAVGTGFALSAKGELDEADGNEDYCIDQRCTPAGLKKVDSAEDKANIATVAFVGGVAAVGVGVYLFLTAADAGSNHVATRLPAVLPVVEPSQLGLQLQREF